MIASKITKFLGINLIKDIKYFYIKNYIILMKENKEDTT